MKNKFSHLNDHLFEALERVKDDYLGDGVYASFDGYYITLDLRGQDSTTQIALEPKVMDALNRYRDRAFPPVGNK